MAAVGDGDASRVGAVDNEVLEAQTPNADGDSYVWKSNDKQARNDSLSQPSSSSQGSSNSLIMRNVQCLRFETITDRESRVRSAHSTLYNY